HYIDVFRKASKDPRVQKQMEAKGTDIVFMAGAEYGRFMDQNFARLKKLAIDIGMYKGK
ncbi:MAG: hypothetical protein GWN87_16855, partial [Desulfuromonadales bacterium]|nr:hypothetical protein [Desulfuromonadales bacterium]